jgi:hypothetical protein
MRPNLARIAVVVVSVADEVVVEVAIVDEAIGDEAIGDEAIGDEAIGAAGTRASCSATWSNGGRKQQGNTLKPTTYYVYPKRVVNERLGVHAH